MVLFDDCCAVHVLSIGLAGLSSSICECCSAVFGSEAYDNLLPFGQEAHCGKTPFQGDCYPLGPLPATVGTRNITCSVSFAI